MTTRRDFARTLVAGFTWPVIARRVVAASPVGGVRLGVQTYSFRDIARAGDAGAIDVIVDAMKATGLDECELWSPQIEAVPLAPRDATPSAQRHARQALRAWRLKVGPGVCEATKRRFAAAGLTIYAYNLSFNESFTDEEITSGFEAARALGAEVITASTTLPMAKRLVPFAERHGIPVAMHNHSNVTDPNEFATPLSFTTALALSPLFRVNLDIGHFTAADFDALAFLEQHHGRISNLHLKDRKAHQGANVPWGEGDTPIKETLLWLKRHQSPVRAYVEYEYPGTRGSIAEVTACAAFARAALLA